MAIIAWPGLESERWIELDLPIELTPYDNVREEIRAALYFWNKHRQDQPLTEPDLLSSWLLANVIEIWGRSEPVRSKSAPLEKIDFLPSDLLPGKDAIWFELELWAAGSPRVEHLHAGYVRYDLHARLHPNLVRTLNLTEAAPAPNAPVTPVDAKPLSDDEIVEQLVPALHDLGRQKRPDAFRLVTERFKQQGIKIDDKKHFRLAWKRNLPENKFGRGKPQVNLAKK